jgi:hypothetical protein
MIRPVETAAPSLVPNFAARHLRPQSGAWDRGESEGTCLAGSQPRRLASTRIEPLRSRVLAAGTVAESTHVPTQRPASGFELLAFAVAVAAASTGFGLAFVYLPPITGYPATFGRPGNWFGQPVYGYAAGFLLFIYAVKQAILRQLPSPALGWYVLLVLCSLPYIWFFVVLDWFNRQVYHVECWIGYPITFLTIPTVSFLKDRLNPDGPSIAWYLIRSAIEIFILFPLWIVAWGFISLYFLGWIWI